MAWSDIDAEAEKELRMSLRLYAAKVRRIEKAQAGKRHGSLYLELKRIYKAELELTQAKATRAEVEADLIMPRPTCWRSSASCCALRGVL